MILKAKIMKINKNCSDCTSRDNSMVLIPNAVYVAMLVTVLGSLMMSSCEKEVPPVVVPVDTDTQAPVQKNLTNMLQGLGLISVISTTKSVSLAKGDIMEMSFIDEYEGAKMSMKINEEESTKNNQVYYVTFKYLDNGKGSDLRYTYSASGDTTIIKKEVKVNGEYASRGTFELTPNLDKTVSQKLIMPNGSKIAIYTYESKSQTSLTRINESDESTNILDNILIVQK